MKLDDIKLLAKKVYDLGQTRPDEKAQCHYAVDGEPCCIVGTAAIETGVCDMDDLANAEGSDASVLLSDNDFYSLNQYPVPLEYYALEEFVLTAQDQQDSGKRWGDAVKIALAKHQRSHGEDHMPWEDIKCQEPS